MKKRIIAWLTAILCLLSAVPAAFAADDPAADPSYDGPAAVGQLPEQDDSIPRITSALATENGMTLSWTPYPEAAMYFVFAKENPNSWKIIGRTSATTFEHRLTPDGAEIVYTVRAADKNGAFISGFDREGYASSCLPSPVPTGVVNTVGGQRFMWNAVDNAEIYRVYVNSGGGWKAVADTDTTAYLNTAVTSGKTYAYTVRCFKRGSKTPCSYFDRKGVRAMYLAAPGISSFVPVKGGISIRWNKVKGAVRYCVFLRAGGKWKKLGYTDHNSFSHLNLTDGALYTYTVRCADSKGDLVSDFITQNTSFRYLAPPKLTSVKNRVLRWNAVNTAAGYRVFRKEFGKTWEAVGDTAATYFTDRPAKNKLYRYTVRCTDARGKLISYFDDNGLYYCNGNPADGRIRVGDSTLNFSRGRLRQGYVTIDGRMYYFNAYGVLQKNGLVGNSKDGWRYADKYGVIDLHYTGLAANSAGLWYLKNGSLDRTARLAVTYGGADYNVTKGKAHPVRTEEERTLFRALKLANRVASVKLPKEQRLRILWDYIKNAYEEMNPRLPDYTGMDWPVIYANDMLIYGRGNCLSYGAEFAYLAKAIGYDDVYACHSGGHGWAEIDGLVYDPEWSNHNFGYSYYALSYYTHTDQDYRGAISPGYAWMHIKICPHL